MAPRVSVIVPAYNLARFLPAALDSALAQDWPADGLEIVVVDDGSSDDTPAVIAAYGARIRAVRQANKGLVGAVDRGLAEATGEYIALLDADDEWPADRVRRQVEFLEAHPAVGLVHGDMEVIDQDGATIAESFFARYGHRPPRGRVLGALLGGNFVSGGASLFRASLMPAVHPIAADAAYPDWWIAANIAAVAEIDHLPGSFNRYRYHGANMGLGSGPERLGGILRAEIPWRRWMLRNLIDDRSLSPQELGGAFQSWEHGLLRATIDTGASARSLVDAGPDERTRARQLDTAAAKALAAGEPALAARRWLGALAEDPWDGAARLQLQLALASAQEAPQPAPQPPLCTSCGTGVVTLAAAGELVGAPELLEAYASVVDGASAATLLVLQAPGDALSALVELVRSRGLDGEEAAQIVVIPEPATLPARRLLQARASYVLGAPAGFALPRHAALAERSLASAPAPA